MVYPNHSVCSLGFTLLLYVLLLVLLRCGEGNTRGKLLGGELGDDANMDQQHTNNGD